MKYINRIEIQGNIGKVMLMTSANGKRYVHLSVATNRIYRSGGEMKVETMWHSVTAFEGKGIMPLDSLSAGMAVRITGRLKPNPKTLPDGSVITQCETVAKTLERAAADEEDWD